MKQYQHIVQAVFSQPWMIRQEVLDTIAALVHLRSQGGALSDDEIRARLAMAAGAAGPRGGARTVGAVGIIPIYGTIFPRANLMTEFSGGATVAGIRASFRQALADESIGSILFDIDSPGGMVDGIEELATEIREARGLKPMASIADYWMGSAAYYVGSQADEVVASPSAMVGWVGAVAIHTEFSKADEMAGITTTIFRDPPGKYGANKHEVLSEQGAAELQLMVEDYSGQFRAAVARGRGVSVASVRSDFGGGGGMTAARAKAAGLVDRVATLDEVVARLATGKVTPRRKIAADSAGLQRVFLHRADGTEEELIPDAGGLVTAELGEGPEPMPQIEQNGQPPADEVQPEPAADLALLRGKHRAHSR